MSDPKAKIRLEAEAALGPGIRQALGQIDGFSKQAKGVLKGVFAGISIAGVTAAVAKTLQFGETLNNATIKAGISSKAFTELAYAARQTGVDTESLSTSFRFMQRAISEAASGSKAQKETFAALGLTFRELKGLSPEAQFELLADRINTLKDPTDKARAAMEVFGRAGGDLLPLFEQGAEGIRKAREEAEEMGQSFSKEQLQRLDEAGDSIDQLKASFEAMAITLVSKVAPAFTRFFSDLAGVTPKATKIQEELDTMLSQSPQLFAGLEEKRQARIADLRRQLRLTRAPVTHNRGAALSSPSDVVPGFTDTAAAEALKKALEKEKEEFEKLAEDIHKTHVKLGDDTYAELTETFRDLSEQQGEFVGGWKQVYEKTVDDINVYTKEVIDEFSVYADQAARNMQDAFADFLFDPFQDGLKGMLKGFVDVIRRMVAEAAAAKIFGSKSSGGFGLGDIITGGLGAIFGGKRAEGGPVIGGRAYVVGERGPEMFVPGRSGSIIPNGGGGVHVEYKPYIDARGATSELINVLPEILKRNNDALESQIVEGLRRRKYAI